MPYIRFFLAIAICYDVGVIGYLSNLDIESTSNIDWDFELMIKRVLFLMFLLFWRTYFFSQNNKLLRVNMTQLLRINMTKKTHLHNESSEEG